MQDFYMPQFIIRLLDNHLHRILSNSNAPKRRGSDKDHINVIPDSNVPNKCSASVVRKVHINNKVNGRETKNKRKRELRNKSEKRQLTALEKRERFSPITKKTKRQIVLEANEIPKRSCDEVLDLCSDDDDDGDDDNEVVQVDSYT
jgi:hypothetical protein